MIREIHLEDAAHRNLPDCPVCFAQRKGACVTEGGINSRRPHPERERAWKREVDARLRHSAAQRLVDESMRKAGIA